MAEIRKYVITSVSFEFNRETRPDKTFAKYSRTDRLCSCVFGGTMGYRDLVLYIGYGEIGTSLKTNAARVKEYVDLSCTNPSSNYLAVSWCTHFVHWTVEQAGRRGKIAKAPLGNKSTSRMAEAFVKTSNPRPGDIYHMPYVNGKATHHFGIVSDVYGSEIESLDGNSGDWRDPRTDWTTKYGGGIGGGMVCLNTRKKKEIAFYLELTEDDF